MGFEDKYSVYTDDQLITRYKENSDNQCVGVLYQRYGHLVLGLCFKYLKNKEDASDAVSQIFIKLLEDLKKHKITYFKSWLYVYSKNYCLMELRKRQSQLKRELDLNENVVLVMDYSSAEHLNEKEQQIQRMEQAIALLNTEQKICIELFYLKNKSYNEIVSITGYSANDVKSYIQNGKRNLKLKLELPDHEKRE